MLALASLNLHLTVFTEAEDALDVIESQVAQLFCYTNAGLFHDSTLECGKCDTSRLPIHHRNREDQLLKGTVSPDYKCLEVISIESPLLGHVTPDI